jgi:hypothetical protein
MASEEITMEFETALRQEIERIRKRLRELEGLGERVFGRKSAPRTGRRSARRKPARRKRTAARKPVSAKRRAAQKRQGQYLAAVRSLTPAQRGQVKRIRAEKGFNAAITEARKLRTEKKSPPSRARRSGRKVSRSRIRKRAAKTATPAEQASPGGSPQS